MERVQIPTLAMKIWLTAEYSLCVVWDKAMTYLADMVRVLYDTPTMVGYHVKFCIMIIVPLYHPVKGEGSHIGSEIHSLTANHGWGIAWDESIPHIGCYSCQTWFMYP